MDTVMLARMHFAWNISFHILFPTITIALSWLLLFFRWRWLRTHDLAWLNSYKLWTKIFALSFALGVVSGIPMSLQFGSNWPGFMERAGAVAGPLLGYEVLTAFFLEAAFLGIMLFGQQRVSERVHLFATAMVAIGTSLSAFWILSLNSWMQTPTGVVMQDGQIVVQSWRDIVFNPSFPYRLTHKLLASGLTVSFLLAGFGAWQIWRNAHTAATSKFMRTGIYLAALLIPLQIMVGDLHGLNTLQHQPQKVAAMEGIWQTGAHQPLLLFAMPDEAQQKNHAEIAIPHLASLILRHDVNGVVQGLNDFPQQHPPVAPVFFSFRVMVGLGLLMLLTSWTAVFFLRRVQFDVTRLPRWLLRVLMWTTFSGWIATLAGWYVTEIGRQPYIVYGLIRSSEVATQTAHSSVGSSLLMFVALYSALLIAYVLVLMRLVLKARHVETVTHFPIGAKT